MDAPVPINPFPPVPAGHYTGPMRLRVNGLPGARIDQERVAELHHIARVMTDQCFAHCRAFGSQQAMRRHIEADGTRIQVNVLACSYPPMVTAWIWTPELPVLEGKPVHINEDQVWIPGLFLAGDYVLEPPTGITPNFCSLVAEQNGWRLFTRPKHPVTGKELIPEGRHYFSLPTTAGVAMMFEDSDGKLWYAQEGGQPFKEAEGSYTAVLWQGEDKSSRTLFGLNDFKGISWAYGGGVGKYGEYVNEEAWTRRWDNSHDPIDNGDDAYWSIKKELYKEEYSEDYVKEGSPTFEITRQESKYTQLEGTCHENQIWLEAELNYRLYNTWKTVLGPYVQYDNYYLQEASGEYAEYEHTWVCLFGQGDYGDGYANYSGSKVITSYGENNEYSLAEVDLRLHLKSTPYTCTSKIIGRSGLWNPIYDTQVCTEYYSTEKYYLEDSEVTLPAGRAPWWEGWAIANVTVDLCTPIFLAGYGGYENPEFPWYGVYDKALFDLNELRQYFEEALQDYNGTWPDYFSFMQALRPFANQRIALPLPQ
jgi:hypothetical protein